MTVARFPVYWHFDGTTQGTVTIDRNSGTINIRPHRRHKSYELPLAFVAQLVAERCIKAEAAEKIRARKAKRRGL